MEMVERRYTSSEISEREFERMKNDVRGGG
jgi:uncharacterized membrane protein